MFLDTNVVRVAVLGLLRNKDIDLTPDVKSLIDNLHAAHAMSFFLLPYSEHLLCNLKSIQSLLTPAQAWSFISFPEGKHTMGLLSIVSTVSGLTDGHALAFRAFPDNVRTIEILKKVRALNPGGGGHAWVFTNLHDLQKTEYMLKELAKLTISKTEEQMFLSLPQDKRTLEAFKVFMEMEHTDVQANVFTNMV